MADLKWIFKKEKGGRGVYNDYQYLQMDTELVRNMSIIK